MYQYLDAKPVLSKMAAPFVVVFFSPFVYLRKCPQEIRELLLYLLLCGA